MTFRRQRGRAGQRGGILSNLVAMLFLLAFCAALFIARRPLLRFAGESWVVEDALDHADAIAVLSDDNFYADRATRGAELFRQRLAPVVVASGRRLRPSAGIAELMEHDLIERGVPKDHILRYPQDIENTREEALGLSKLAAEKNWHSLIVVTSNYHTRRARYIFRRVFPATLDVRIASARDGDFDATRWWEQRKSLKELVREFAGMVVAMWELRDYRPGAADGKASLQEFRRVFPSANAGILLIANGWIPGFPLLLYSS